MNEERSKIGWLVYYQQNPPVGVFELCKKLGIKMVFGLGDKIQSSSWLLKEKK